MFIQKYAGNVIDGVFMRSKDVLHKGRNRLEHRIRKKMLAFH